MGEIGTSAGPPRESNVRFVVSCGLGIAVSVGAVMLWFDWSLGRTLGFLGIGAACAFVCYCFLASEACSPRVHRALVWTGGVLVGVAMAVAWILEPPDSVGGVALILFGVPFAILGIGASLGGLMMGCAVAIDHVLGRVYGSNVPERHG